MGQELETGSNGDKWLVDKGMKRGWVAVKSGQNPTYRYKLMTEVRVLHRKKRRAFSGPWPWGASAGVWAGVSLSRTDTPLNSDPILLLAVFFPRRLPQPLASLGAGLAESDQEPLLSCLAVSIVLPRRALGGLPRFFSNWGLIFLYTKVMGLEETTTAWGLRPEKSPCLGSGVTSRPGSLCTPAGRGASRPGCQQR